VTDSLFHIIDRDAWTAAEQAGELRPSSLRSEGFVHFSFANQVAATANLHYRVIADLIVVEFDPAKLGMDVVVEDSYGGGTTFPHVYAAIPTAAAVAVHPLTRDASGDYVFNSGRASDAASPDH